MAIPKANAMIYMATILLMLVAFGNAQTTVPCDTVTNALVPCATFLTQVGVPVPTRESDCCAGVQHINDIATTQAIRQDICRCIETTANEIHPIQSAVTQLPSACGVPFPYSFSATQDCSLIE